MRFHPPSSPMPESAVISPLLLIGLLGGHALRRHVRRHRRRAVDGRSRHAPRCISPTTPGASSATRRPAPSPVRSAKRAWPCPGSCRCAAPSYLLANLMLIALGLYLMGLTRALAFSERFGQKLWRHLQPLTRRFCPHAARRRLFRSACCGAGCPAAWSTVPGNRPDQRFCLHGAGLMLAFGAWHPAQSAARRPACDPAPGLRAPAGGPPDGWPAHPRLWHLGTDRRR
jgi:hypothetical protein